MLEHHVGAESRRGLLPAGGRRRELSVRPHEEAHAVDPTPCQPRASTRTWPGNP